jgi:hypothetical protein
MERKKRGGMGGKRERDQNTVQLTHMLQSSKVALLNRDLADVYKASQNMSYRVPR